jgi:hypothetical protein
MRMIVPFLSLLVGAGSTIAADLGPSVEPKSALESKAELEPKSALLEGANDLAAMVAAIAWIKDHPGISVRHLTVTPRQGRTSVARIEYTEQ